MYTKFQRFIAHMLLFSLMLQSCISNSKVTTTCPTQVTDTSSKEIFKEELENKHNKLVEAILSPEQSINLSRVEFTPFYHKGSTLLEKDKQQNVSVLEGSTFIASNGSQVKDFQLTEKGWKAVVIEQQGNLSRKRGLEVVFFSKYSVADLNDKQDNKIWQKQHIRIGRNKDSKEVVCIGKWGLDGGTRCKYPIDQWRLNVDGSKTCPANKHHLPVPPRACDSSGRFNTTVLQYSEKIKEIARYFDANAYIHNASEAQNMVWRLENYMDDIKDLAAKARSLDFNAYYSGQFSQVHEDIINELAQVVSKARVSAQEMKKAQIANVEINKYNATLNELHHCFGGPLYISTVSQAEQIKVQVRDYIALLNESSTVITSALSGVNFEISAAFWSNHVTRIHTLEQLCKDVDKIGRNIARDDKLQATVAIYRERAEQIQNEFGDQTCIASVEQAEQMQYSLQEHLDYLENLWSHIQSIGFSSADSREKAQISHQSYMDSLQRLYDEVGKAKESIAKSNKVKTEIARYHQRMLLIQEEFREEVRINHVEQATNMQANLQAHISYLLNLWEGIEEITDGAPEKTLCQFHEAYLENLQQLCNELCAIECKIAHDNRLQAEIARYQARIQIIQNAFQGGIRITSLEQAEEMKSQLEEHINYLLTVWENIETITGGQPEETLLQFHTSNFSMVQGLYDDISKMEHAMAKNNNVQAEVARYQARIQIIQNAFQGGIRITSLEQAEEMKSQLEEHINYLLTVWENIETITDGQTEETLLQFHTSNFSMIQGLYDSISKTAQSLGAVEKKRTDVERYQKVLDAVKQDFGKPAPITSLEQAEEKRSSLQGYIRSLEKIGPIVSGHQARLNKLNNLYQHIDEQVNIFAYDNLVKEQQKHIEEETATINTLLQNHAADPREVIAKAESLKAQLAADQQSIEDCVLVKNKSGHSNYLQEIQENVENILSSYKEKYAALDRREVTGSSEASIESILDATAASILDAASGSKEPIERKASTNFAQSITKGLSAFKNYLADKATEGLSAFKNYLVAKTTEGLSAFKNYLVAKTTEGLSTFKDSLVDRFTKLGSWFKGQSSSTTSTSPLPAPTFVSPNVSPPIPTRIEESSEASHTAFGQAMANPEPTNDSEPKTNQGLEEEQVEEGFQDVLEEKEVTEETTEIEAISFDNLEEANLAAEAYLESFRQADSSQQAELRQKGMALLRSIEGLKKVTKDQYRTTGKSLVFSELDEHSWLLFVAQRKGLHTQYVGFKALRNQLQTAMRLTQAESRACGLRMRPNAETGQEEYYSSSEEQDWSDQSIRIKQAVGSGIGSALKNQVKFIIPSIVRLALDPKGTVQAYMALLQAIPQLPELIKAYYDEFQDFNEEEKAEALSQLLTDVVLTLLPMPKLSVGQIASLSDKLGKAGKKAVQEAAKIARLGEKWHPTLEKIFRPNGKLIGEKLAGKKLIRTVSYEEGEAIIKQLMAAGAKKIAKATYDHTKKDGTWYTIPGLGEFGIRITTDISSTKHNVELNIDVKELNIGLEKIKIKKR